MNATLKMDKMIREKISELFTDEEVKQISGTKIFDRFLRYIESGSLEKIESKKSKESNKESE